MAKPWYFPFVPSHWLDGGSDCCPDRKANYAGSQESEDEDLMLGGIRLRKPALASEPDPAHLPVGLEIDHLCKVLLLVYLFVLNRVNFEIIQTGNFLFTTLLSGYFGCIWLQ